MGFPAGLNLRWVSFTGLGGPASIPGQHPVPKAGPGGFLCFGNPV